MVEITFKEDLDVTQYVHLKHILEQFLIERKIPFTIHISTQKSSMFIESLHVRPLIKEIKKLLDKEKIEFEILIKDR